MLGVSPCLDYLCPQGPHRAVIASRRAFVCCGISTFDEIRFLKAIHVISTYSIPGLASLHRFPLTHAPADNRRFHKNISVNAMPSAGFAPSAASPPTPPVTPPPPPDPLSSNQQPRQPQAQFNSVAVVRYLIVAVSQTEVLWPLSVSVGSPEAVSVMRPADFNSGIPFLTVLALPTLIFN